MIIQNMNSQLKVELGAMSSAGRREQSNGFTLVELLVVIAIIAILSVLFFPALAATHDRSNRALCQYNLHQIAIAMTQYAADNSDTLYPARSAGGPTPGGNLFNQTALDAPSATVANQIGLTPTNHSIWTCPNIPGRPLLISVISPPEWSIGYQYFGGITRWYNSVGNTSSRSPVKLSQSKPYWTLAADDIYYDSSAPSPSQWNVPHRTSDAQIPLGGNQVFCDGSVQWIDFEKMYYLTTWDTFSRIYFFYQNPTDFNINPLNFRFLKATYYMSGVR